MTDLCHMTLWSTAYSSRCMILDKLFDKKVIYLKILYTKTEFSAASQKTVSGGLPSSWCSVSLEIVNKGSKNL
jgi:hypothetical protein